MAVGLGVPVLLAAVVTAGYSGWSSYTIRPGDTLEQIAQRYGTSVPALVKANELPGSGNLRLGDVLTIPGASSRATSSSRPAPASSDPTYSGNTFAGRTYSDGVVSAAARNRATLENRDVPSRDGMRDLIARTARKHGVDPSIALAISYQESGFNQRRVSVANAIGAMQVIPASGDWASDIVGRRLDLLDPQDNATAGVVLLEVLTRVSGSERTAVASYYQGLSSVRRNGMFADTEQYVANVMALRERF